MKSISLICLLVIVSLQGSSARSWLMPEEGDPHKCTWMTFGASRSIWGRWLLRRVRRDLAKIANQISQYETVKMLVRQEDLSRARNLMNDNIELIVNPLDDIWARDTAPVFVKGSDGTRGAVNLNFNGWGEKQRYGNDRTVAPFIAQKAGASLVSTDLVLEGGSIEVDGQGTAIIAESCVLNDNRNPGWTKSQVEAELNRIIGIQKVIWIPGIRGQDITDGHTDFFARFVKPGVVLVGIESDSYYETWYEATRNHANILRDATDVNGNSLRVVEIPGPQYVRPTYDNEEFAAGYIGFYVFNGGVMVAQFGDRQADSYAKKVLQQEFPGRTIIQVNIDGIAAGGGSVHCATMQEPE